MPDPKAWLVPEELTHEFVDVFSGLERALKHVGLRRNRFGAVEADWDAFGRSIHQLFTDIKDPAVAEAVAFLMNAPPRKQVEINGLLEWQNIQRPPGLSDTEWLLRIVCRVRNNLVHGGKRSPNGPIEPGRDKQLVQNALTVLQRCMPLNVDVRAAYEAVAF